MNCAKKLGKLIIYCAYIATSSEQSVHRLNALGISLEAEKKIELVIR